MPGMRQARQPLVSKSPGGINRFGQSPERLPGQPQVEIKDLSELPELIE